MWCESIRLLFIDTRVHFSNRHADTVENKWKLHTQNDLQAENHSDRNHRKLFSLFQCININAPAIHSFDESVTFFCCGIQYLRMDACVCEVESEMTNSRQFNKTYNKPKQVPYVLLYRIRSYRIHEHASSVLSYIKNITILSSIDIKKTKTEFEMKDERKSIESHLKHIDTKFQKDPITRSWSKTPQVHKKVFFNWILPLTTIQISTAFHHYPILLKAYHKH